MAQWQQRQEMEEALREESAWMVRESWHHLPPVGAYVQVKYRDGIVLNGYTSHFSWALHGDRKDIVAYRVIPSQA